MLNPKLKVTTTTLEASCLVRIEGTIDESTDAQALAPPGAAIVLYDLDGVKRITSYGVLQWVKGLKELKAQYYGFLRCRPCIVRQFNMVAGFGKRGEILSIYLPYFCDSCDVEFDSLLDLRTAFSVAQSASPPETRCPTCDGSAEFDDVPKSFLAFTSDYPKPNPPELALRVMADLARAWPARNRSVSPPARAALASAFQSATAHLSTTGPSTAGPDTKALRALSPAVTKSGSPESVDRLRKLQDDLDITRDRLKKMIKERKSKT